MQLRFIKTSGATYIRKEDIAQYLLEIAATCDTDHRSTILQASEFIQHFGETNDQLKEKL
jgi:hypothetical protein